jgi:Zn-dependent protease with chaperone function
MTVQYRFIKFKLIFASGITMVFLAILLSIPLLGLLLISKTDTVISLIVFIFFTFILNSILFFKSRSLMDSALKSQYREINWNMLAYIQEAYPISYKCIQRISKKYKLHELIIATIDDKIPLAFTYGNFRGNARIVVSTGLLNLLSDEELAAVCAHELGHIVRYDFAVMTLAQTLTISLYLLGIGLARFVNSGSNLLLVKLIGLISLALYYIGFIASLYLSRIREFSADNFAAKNVSDPNALSRALVKMVYKSASLKRINTLPQSARALNIFDLKVKKSISTKKGQETQNPMQDLFNPSSHWQELISTHPFPISRIKALSDYSERKGIVEVDIPEIISNLELIETSSDDDKRENKNVTDSKIKSESHSVKIFMRRGIVVLGSFSLIFFIVSIVFLVSNNSVQDTIASIICLLIGAFFFTVFVNSIYQKPGYIMLNTAGIEIQNPNFFGKEGINFFFKWSDIEEIGVYDSDVKGIGFNFSDSYTGETQNFLNQVLVGYDFILYNSFEQKNEELCHQLQKWKKAYS